MEVVVKVSFVYLDKVLLALNRVLGCFPLYPFETERIVLDHRCAQQTVGEVVDEDRRRVRPFAHDDIRFISRNKTVRTGQRHIPLTDKTQRRPPLGVKGIELRQRTMVHDGLTATEPQTVAQRIGQLTIGQRDVTVIGADAVAFGIMDDTMLHGQSLHGRINGCRVYQHRRHRITDFRGSHLITR